ncbi:MAG: histidine phosphatase family protein [Myxococcota bacterium]
MILLLRHGQTVWNRDGRVQGQHDSPLTALGEAQAARMAACCARLVEEARGDWQLVASPSGRAQQTAAYVAEATGLAVQPDARLLDVGCGAWEGRLYDEVAAEHPEHFAAHWLYGAPGGETFEDVHRRAADWLAAQGPEPDRRVIVVGHGAWGRHLRAAYAGLPRDVLMRLPVPQDALFRLVGGDIRAMPT